MHGLGEHRPEPSRALGKWELSPGPAPPAIARIPPRSRAWDGLRKEIKGTKIKKPPRPSRWPQPTAREAKGPLGSGTLSRAGRPRCDRH